MNARQAAALCALCAPAFVSCVSLVSPAGRRCDADHPCQGDRVCAADGFCRDPLEGLDPSDSGTNGAGWNSLFVEDWEALIEGPYVNTVGRWNADGVGSGFTFIENAGVPYGRILSVTPDTTSVRVSVGFTPADQFRLHLPMNASLSAFNASVTVTARTGASLTDGLYVMVDRTGWSYGAQSGTTQTVLESGAWAQDLGAQAAIDLWFEARNTTLSLRSGAQTVSTRSISGAPPHIEGLSVRVPPSVDSVELLQVEVDVPAP